MPDRPDARELLEVAHAATVELTAKAAPQDRLALRMIAHAMAIALREMAAGAGATGDDTRELWRRVDECDLSDVASQRRLHAELTALTRARLAISDPRRLPRDPASR